jgi:microcystin-dependent protein
MPKRLRRWNGTSWDIILDAAAYDFTALNPVGTPIMWCGAGTGATVPAGYLLCDGSAVSRTTYAALFAVIGTKYGAGDGSTTFTLPLANLNHIPSAIALATNTRATTFATGIQSANHTHANTANASASAVTGNAAATATTATNTGANSNDHTHTVQAGSSSPQASKTTSGISANHTHGIPALTVPATAITANAAAQAITMTNNNQSADHTHNNKIFEVCFIIKT